MAENRALINPQIVKDSLDAIRTKKGTSEDILVSKMPEEILSIPTGGGVGEDTSALLDAIGVESREDVAMANGLAQALTDSATEQVWSGERESADGMPIKDGVAFVSALKGKTMKVNQLISNRGISANSNMNIVEYDDYYHITPKSSVTTTTYTYFYMPDTGYKQSIIGHKYLVVNKIRSNNTNFLAFAQIGVNATSASSSSGVWEIKGQIFTATADGNVRMRFGGKPSVLASLTDAYFDFAKEGQMIFDLTDMGLDYITTPDEFANLFGRKTIAELPYIPYQDTNLQSFAPNAIVSKTKWKSVDMGTLPWAKISSTEDTFYAKINNIVVPTNDAERLAGLKCSRYPIDTLPGINSSATNKTMKRYGGFVYVKDSSYTTAASFKASLNGVVLDYESTEMTELGKLPFDLTTIVDSQGNPLFPEGELRSAGSVADLVDYANDVAVRGKRMMGKVDMGSLNWVVTSAAGHSRFYAALPNVKAYNNNVPNINSTIYKASNKPIAPSFEDKTLGYFGGRIYLFNEDYEGSTGAQFKSAMSGVELIFELAEPIEGEAPLTKSFYPVQSNGTEEAICDTIVPMNAEIRYRVDTESLLTQSTALLAYSNEVTGANDTSLGNAVKTLTDSYK